ncbi:MAG: hypothetical protein Fur0041_10950 [Bacteroidia bacterium]
MKKIAFLFAFLFSILAINAQNASSPNQERAHVQAIRMQKSLALSQEQTDKVETVFLNHLNEFEKIKADQNLSKEQKEAEFKKNQESKDAELQKILTPEQFNRYQEMLKERREQRAQSGQ